MDGDTKVVGAFSTMDAALDAGIDDKLFPVDSVVGYENDQWDVYSSGVNTGCTISKKPVQGLTIEETMV